MHIKGASGEYILAEELTSESFERISEKFPSALTLLWFTHSGSELIIDGRRVNPPEHTLICTTEFHTLEVRKISRGRLLRFNRDFYCILTHDDEVSCRGLLFFGASQLPEIYLTEKYRTTLEALWGVIENEMNQEADNLQLEMLQMLVKRFLILSTRAYKEQGVIDHLNNEQVDLIRSYNFLVEQHFRTRHKVSDYAALLFKSPKTLSNLFAKAGDKTPLMYIHDRIAMEARRRLRYSDLSVKEISFELGFEDLQTFSRFFKRQEGVSPLEFRERE